MTLETLNLLRGIGTAWPCWHSSPWRSGPGAESGVAMSFDEAARLPLEEDADINAPARSVRRGAAEGNRSIMSSGFSLFVVIGTILNIVAAVWLLLAMRKRGGESQTTSDTTGHVWDGDLREYNNPLPRWWLWLFVLSTVFSIGYVILYPGMGNARGALGWSQKSQFDAMQAEQEKKTQAMLAQFAGRSSLELSQDARAIAVGRNLFANNCAACHGSDGRGAPGFPNITDADWLWGGEPETIEATIREGRNGIMTPWIDVLGPKGVDDVVAHVMTLSGRKAPTGDASSRQGAVRDNLLRLPWRRWPRHARSRCAEPDRQHLAPWWLRGEDPRNDRQGPPRHDASAWRAAGRSTGAGC